MTADELLEEAEDLITCQVDRDSPHSKGVHNRAECPWCEWHREYMRFKDERSKQEAVSLARKIGV